MASPSGEQIEISYDDQRAIVVTVGGGVRTYDLGGAAVLDGYAADQMCDGGRCQTLAPWPNRVQDGRWSWEGADLQLGLTEPGQHNAIHGLVRWLDWTVVDRSQSSVTVSCLVAAQPGYPWSVETSNTWSLGPEGLSVETVIVNRSAARVPVGAGFHPYLTVGAATIDKAHFTLPAGSRLVTGAQQIPVGVESVAGTPYDFRAGRAIGDLAFDFAFTDLTRDADGRARARLASADGSVTRTLWVDESYAYLEVFTGDTLGNPARRRQGLAIEPMTMPPNALVTGEAVVVLDPGDSWRGQWGINPHE